MLVLFLNKKLIKKYLLFIAILSFGTIQAQENFSISLLRHRNRIRSLVGIARASNANGNRETAIESYQQLVHQLKNANAELPELKEARIFLRGK